MISELVVNSERKMGGVRNSNNSNSKSGELIEKRIVLGSKF